MFVRHFVSRPTLLVRTRTGDQTKEEGLTFVDALKRCGRGLASRDLEQAYARAGNSFIGQMQQTFVVLHEGITKPREKARQIKDAKKRAAAGEHGAGTGDGAGAGFRSVFGSGAKNRRGLSGGRGRGK